MPIPNGKSKQIDTIVIIKFSFVCTYPSTKALEGNLHNSSENMSSEERCVVHRRLRRGKKERRSEECETMSSLKFEDQLGGCLMSCEKVLI